MNDDLDEKNLETLSKIGVKLIALRSAGYNHVNLESLKNLGLKVVYVPEYSPNAIAEHAVALILSLNRKIHRAHNRVRENNFSLDGLMGFDLNKKTVGIIGTGRIGSVLANILIGFGCNVLAYDQFKNSELVSEKISYVEFDELLGKSDIISLHLPLTEKTRHIVDESAFRKMKSGVMLINTGRGALIDTPKLVEFLKSGHIGSAGLDVYENEKGIFFENLEEKILKDDQLARLMNFSNVIITPHQAFFTTEALKNIAVTTFKNISEFENGDILSYEIC